MPDAGLHHTERLALVGWSTDGSFWACGRRTEDFSRLGRPGRCSVIPPLGSTIGSPNTEAPSKPLDAESALADSPARRDYRPDAFAPDTSRPGTGPTACPGTSVQFEDMTGDPGLPPTVAARAILVGPGEQRLVLDAWRPPLSVDGDYFAVETSFSPEGKRLAIVHSAVGRGEGEQAVDVISVELRPMPTCP